MSDNFKKLVEEAEQILITSHTSPDPDAIASVLLLGETLKLNFPEKKIEMALEEEPDGLSFLDGYDKVKFALLIQSVDDFKPGLIIIVDANSFERCSRKDGQKIRDYVANNSTKTAVLDHHEPEKQDEVNVYINSGNPACAQEIYELCFDQLSLKKPEGYAQTTMLGLYADTGGFAYRNPHYKQTFQLAADLIGAGADIEKIKNRLSQFSEDQLKTIGELAVNTTHEGDYTYSFISDEFANRWSELDKPADAMGVAIRQFVNSYVRNVDGRKWGFVVYLNPLQGENMYSVSLRSESGARDVAAIARKLEGGGHISSAGGKVMADNIGNAIAYIKEAIIST